MLHKLWWNGCERFKSGHGIVGEVSGFKAVIHCGDELWFGRGMEVSAGYQRLAINTGENALGTNLESDCPDLIYIEFA